MSNQEILFRGFYPCKDGYTTIYVDGVAVEGEWIEGSAIVNGKEQYIYENSGVSLMSTTDKIITPNFVGFYAWKVLPSTVCQYTGKNDTNGKKIFEGDIIQANFKTPFIVEWDNEGCRFLGTQPNDGSRHFTASNRYICYLNDAQEVTGTIFDKPKEATP